MTDAAEKAEAPPLRVAPQTLIRIRQIIGTSGAIRLKRYHCGRDEIYRQACARMAAEPFLIVEEDTTKPSQTHIMYKPGPNFTTYKAV